MHLDAARIDCYLLDFIALKVVGVDFNGLAAVGRLGVDGAKSRQQGKAAGKRQVQSFSNASRIIPFRYAG